MQGLVFDGDAPPFLEPGLRFEVGPESLRPGQLLGRGLFHGRRQGRWPVRMGLERHQRF